MIRSLALASALVAAASLPALAQSAGGGTPVTSTSTTVSNTPTASSGAVTAFTTSTTSGTSSSPLGRQQLAHRASSSRTRRRPGGGHDCRGVPPACRRRHQRGRLQDALPRPELGAVFGGLLPGRRLQRGRQRGLGAGSPPAEVGRRHVEAVPRRLGAASFLFASAAFAQSRWRHGGNRRVLLRHTLVTPLLLRARSRRGRGATSCSRRATAACQRPAA